MDPGRKIDFQTWESLVCFQSSPGFGGLGGRSFSATRHSSSKNPPIDPLSLGRRLALADPRVPQGAGRAAVDADAAAHALVVVDDEQGVRRLSQGGDLLALTVGHDVRGQHVDAVPGADVLAGAAEDTQLRGEGDVPAGLYPLLEPVGVDRGQGVVVMDARLVRVHRSILSRRLLVATGGLALLLTGRKVLRGPFF